MDTLLPCFYSFIACMAYCVIIQVSPKSILPAAIGGGLVSLIYTLLSPIDNAIVQSFLAGVAASVYAELLSHFRRIPVTTYLIVAIIPLVPGGRIYAAMEFCIAGEMQAFANTALFTMGIAGAIALSILLTSPVMKLFFKGSNRVHG